MRLKESRLERVYLVPAAASAGYLGGLAECFSDERIPLRASILPEEGGLSADERGALSRSRLCLLVPGDAKAKCGDGVAIGDKMHRVVRVQRWSAHIELL